MGSKIKDNGGDLTGVSKKSRKATAAKMGDVASTRANQIKSRSESGFKGETLNDHGLPIGGSEVIQNNKYSNEGGAKFRKEKYANGTKGIVLKPKISIASDATKVKPLTNLKAVSDASAAEISKSTDKQLYAKLNQLSLEDGVLNTNAAKKDQIIDSLATRNMKRRGGYKDGTKGIKIKSK